MKNIIAIFGLFLCLTSCEYAYDYSYKLTNMADTKLDVHVKTFQIDTVFSISKDSTKVLFVKEHGIEGPHGPYFKDVKFDLKEFTVIRNGTQKSTTDYLRNDAWTFSKEPYHQGLYSTIITTDDFNK
jgi:hypothetical protein